MQHSHQTISGPPPVKKTIFFIVMLAFPLATLAVIELGLRAIDYGPNLALFLPQEIGDKTYLIMNPEVKTRYFSRVQFTPNTSNDFFLPQKPAGTIRIFSLGGSTTVGFPYGFVGSFPTFLRERLQKAFPEKRIEVINLGMTATNSFSVNDIAEELFEFSPDLLIVYDGHNEFYGALGISSAETIGGSFWLTKTFLKLVHLRLFHFLKEIFKSVVATFSSSSDLADAGTMMERLAMGQYVPYGTREYSQCLKNFQKNLHELKEICAEKGVPLILGTQVSNVRNQRPFISNFVHNVTAENREKFRLLMSRAEEYFQAGRFLRALSECDSAMVIDSLRADIRFLKARCLDTLGQKGEAKEHYVKARDLDQLRFRASEDFNKAIREQADGKNVFVADIERKFAAASRDSIIGRDLILEHLHPQLFGNFLIANVYAETMKDCSLVMSSQDWQQSENPNESDLWKNRSPSELDERAAQRRVDILTSAWPFRQDMRTVPQPAVSDTIARIIENLVSGSIGWEEAHVQAAEFYAAKRELSKAMAEYQAILSQFPLSVSAHLRSAQLLLFQKDHTKARHHLLASMAVEKTYFAAKHLGVIAGEEKDYPQAILYFQEAKSLGENLRQRSEAALLLAHSQLQMGNAELAVTVLENVLSADPGYSTARVLLTRIKSAQQ